MFALILRHDSPSSAAQNEEREREREREREERDLLSPSHPYIICLLCKRERGFKTF